MIKTMERFAIIQGQKIVETTVSFFFIWKMIETTDRLSIIHGQKIVETTVRFSY